MYSCFFDCYFVIVDKKKKSIHSKIEIKKVWYFPELLFYISYVFYNLDILMRYEIGLQKELAKSVEQTL
mgnify:CR=1 FL=1